MTAEAHPPVISVMLAVPDAAAAARWYGQALGATKLWDLGGVVGLTVAGAPFSLGEPENNGWDFPAALGSRTVRVEVFADDPDAFIGRAPWIPWPHDEHDARGGLSQALAQLGPGEPGGHRAPGSPARAS